MYLWVHASIGNDSVLHLTIAALTSGRGSCLKAVQSCSTRVKNRKECTCVSKRVMKQDWRSRGAQKKSCRTTYGSEFIINPSTGLPFVVSSSLLSFISFQALPSDHSAFTSSPIHLLLIHIVRATIKEGKLQWTCNHCSLLNSAGLYRTTCRNIEEQAELFQDTE